jgi:hypothetical protein
MRFVSKTARAASAIALAQIVALSGLLMGGMVSPAAADPQADAWSEIPDTHMRDVQPTQAEVDAIAPGLWSAIKGHTWPARLSMWTSMGFDPVNRVLIFPHAGGHADYGGTDAECFDLDTPEAGWWRCFPILPLDEDPQTGTADPIYGSPARHTYDNIAYLGNGVFFYGGGAGYRKSGMGTKGAYFLDTLTPSGSYPWTFTPLPAALLPYTGGLSGVHGGYLYLATGSKIARVDMTTGALLNGSARSSGFNSGVGAAGIDPNGLMCASDANYLRCINVVGTFGQWVARPVGANAPAGAVASLVTGYMSMTPVGDSGWFAMWGGGKRVIFFKPGAGNDPQLDEWALFEPETGPTDGTSGRVYEKLHWDASICSLVGYSNIDEGVWVLPVSGVGCVVNEAPEAQDDAFNGAEDTQLAGNVLANDSDEDALTATALTLPAVGVLTLQTDGTFTYDPPLDFFGVVTFDYTVCDPHEACDTATVTLTLIDVPDFAPDEGDYGPNPQASLASLCARPDTLLCDPLDNTPISGPAIDENTPYLTLDQVVDATHYGKWRWANVKTNSAGTSPQVDSQIFVDGNGSLRFTIASQSGAGGGGDYDVNVTPDYYANNPELRVVQGEMIRARYRIRFSCDLLFTDCDPQSPTYKQAYRDYLGSGGFKIGVIGEADFPGEVIDGGEGLGIPVWSNYKERGFLAGYISQWNLNISQKLGSVNGISYFDLQPGPDGQAPCLSHHTEPPLAPAQFNPADPNCFMLGSDQWFTVQEDLFYGQTFQHDQDEKFSHVKLWIAPEGQPFTLVVDKPINLKRSNLQGDVLPTLGRIGISSFMTGKDNSEVHPDAYIWYDNLWVAKVG